MIINIVKVTEGDYGVNIEATDKDMSDLLIFFRTHQVYSHPPTSGPLRCVICDFRANLSAHIG